MNFRQLDLNLLRVLCAIHRTGSVTEAGQQLALSQSATSNALARLRHCFGDALFVRSPSGCTRRGWRSASRRWWPITCCSSRPRCAKASFEPASGCVHWRLSLSDLGEMMFLPALARELRRSSPGSRLSNRAVDAARVSLPRWRAREIDLAIGMLQADHQGVLGELLFRRNTTWR